MGNFFWERLLELPNPGKGSKCSLCRISFKIVRRHNVMVAKKDLVSRFAVLWKDTRNPPSPYIFVLRCFCLED